MSAKEEKQQSLREVMPQTAAIVDELRLVLGKEWADRLVLGKEWADRLVLGGKQGKGTFWSRESCPDGQVREFGSKPRNGAQQRGGR